MRKCHVHEALQSAFQDMNRWKAKAEKYAATATAHAADAEDILGQSYGLMSKVKGVAVLLPDSEAKAVLDRLCSPKGISSPLLHYLQMWGTM